MEREKEAARVVDRRFFENKDFLNLAYEDIPLPIGEEQTISQPSTVIKMLQYLDLRKGQSVLEIGSGSGWNAALISYLIGNKGKVITVERRDSLTKLAKSNIKGFMKYLKDKDKKLFESFSKIRVIHGNFFSYFKESKNKESQSQQPVGNSLSVKNLRILEHTPKQNSLKRIFQNFGCLQLGTNKKNRSELRGIKPNWSNKYDRIIFTAGIDYSDKEVVNTVEKIAEKILANQGIMILPMALGPLLIYKKIKDKLIKNKTKEEYRFVLLRSG